MSNFKFEISNLGLLTTRSIAAVSRRTARRILRQRALSQKHLHALHFGNVFGRGLMVQPPLACDLNSEASSAHPRTWRKTFSASFFADSEFPPQKYLGLSHRRRTSTRSVFRPRNSRAM